MAAPRVPTALDQRDEVIAAQARIARHAIRTPLIERRVALDSGPARVFLKCEQMQPSGAFKMRGAANMLEQLTPAQRQRGVITFSSGNHGQAVAMVARTIRTPAVVVMPTT